jgi:hypothetical protein
MLIILLLAIGLTSGWSQTAKDPSSEPPSLPKSEQGILQGFEKESFGVQEVLKESLALTRRALNYQYGSSDPVTGGLDCSGMVYYVLKKVGLKDVPRHSSDMYLWVRQNNGFHAVWSSDIKTFELDELRPGDLLFWVGTYEIHRDPPITHVMIYAGKLRASGKKVMMGSSEGRTFEGKPQYGVSLFDFKLPGFPLPKGSSPSQGRFIGYGKIPGIDNLQPSGI